MGESGNSSSAIGSRIAVVRDDRHHVSSHTLAYYSVVQRTQGSGSGSPGYEGGDLTDRSGLSFEIAGIIEIVEIVHEAGDSRGIQRRCRACIGNDSRAAHKLIGIAEGAECDSRGGGNDAVVRVGAREIPLFVENQVSGLGGGIGKFPEIGIGYILENDARESQIVGGRPGLRFRYESVVVPSDICGEIICRIDGGDE